MNRVYRAVLLIAVGSAVIGLLPAGALAAATPSGPTEQVTLALTPADRGALHSLGQEKGLSRSARATLARALEPSPTRHGAIATALARLGLSVVAETPWTATASGSAASVLAAFGSARSVAPTDPFGHALPGLPRDLDGLVTAAFGGDETRPRYRPHTQAPFEGSDIRAGYQAPFGATPAAPTTIATLQFSGWDRTNLTHYAAARGLPDPVASGQYTPVLVDGSNESTVDNGGDFEVTLDQEALLGTAPQANQRAYFTPNTDQGELDALAQIHQDATNTAHNGYGLVALSVSWGICEKAFQTGNTAADAAALQAHRDAYAAILADGVTIFTATGDSGAFDCSVNAVGGVDNSAAVDTPSSFPEAVAVGGTTLQTNGATPATYTETAWADSSVPKNDPSYRGNGGGGGISQLIARPSWQAGVAGSDPAQRLVPDVSADADVTTGYTLYYNDGAGATDFIGGGTSLAAPLTAALFTDTLINRGISAGIGDIHQALYSAPAATFRDVTSGDNSFGFLAGYAAQPGYDLSSGLGSPDWTALSPLLTGSFGVTANPFTSVLSVPVSITPPSGVTVTSWKTGTSRPTCDNTGSTTPPTTVALSGADGPKTVYVLGYTSGGCLLGFATTFLDTHGPVAAATAALSYPTASYLTFSWSATDPAPGSGVDHYDVTISHPVPGAAPAIDYVDHDTTATSHPLTGLMGRSYFLSVAAYDRAGNRSGRVVRRVDVPLDDSQFRFGPGWTRQGGYADYGRSANRATARSATVYVWPSFRSLSAEFVFSSYGGLVQVLVDGHLITTIDTYHSGTMYRVVVPIISFASTATHTVRFYVLGRKRAASRSTQVLLDAVVCATY